MPRAQLEEEEEKEQSGTGQKKETHGSTRGWRPDSPMWPRQYKRIEQSEISVPHVTHGAQEGSAVKSKFPYATLSNTSLCSSEALQVYYR